MIFYLKDTTILFREDSKEGDRRFGCSHRVGRKMGERKERTFAFFSGRLRGGPHSVVVNHPYQAVDLLESVSSREALSALRDDVPRSNARVTFLSLLLPLPLSLSLVLSPVPLLLISPLYSYLRFGSRTQNHFFYKIRRISQWRAPMETIQSEKASIRVRYIGEQVALFSKER